MVIIIFFLTSMPYTKTPSTEIGFQVLCTVLNLCDIYTELHNSSTLQNIHTHTLKSKVSNIAPTCRNFFSRVHRKHIKEHVTDLNGHLSQAVPKLTLTFLQFDLKWRGKGKKLLHTFRFHKVHLHTTNPQTQWTF